VGRLGVLLVLFDNGCISFTGGKARRPQHSNYLRGERLRAKKEEVIMAFKDPKPLRPAGWEMGTPPHSKIWQCCYKDSVAGKSRLFGDGRKHRETACLCKDAATSARLRAKGSLIKREERKILYNKERWLNAPAAAARNEPREGPYPEKKKRHGGTKGDTYQMGARKVSPQYQ